MMALRRALHFVFKVGDRTKTATFYRDVLGMKVEDMSTDLIVKFLFYYVNNKVGTLPSNIADKPVNHAITKHRLARSRIFRLCSDSKPKFIINNKSF